MAVLAGAALLASTAPPAVDASPAAASQQRHAAGLVVDTGTEVKPVCVRFSEDAISGEELLRRADVDPVFADYGSMGKAVCALCGTGCPADDCFCESETSGRYWNYVRARDGGWQSSNRGASSTTLRHGDVDGWAWGTRGSKPPYMTFEAICGAPDPGGDDDGDSGPSPTPTADNGGSGGQAGDDTGGDDTGGDDGQQAGDAGDSGAAPRSPAGQDSDGSGDGDEPTDAADAPRTAADGDPTPTASGETAPAPTSPATPTAAAGTPPSDGATPGGAATPTLAVTPDDGEPAAGSTGSLLLFTAVLTALGGTIWWRRTSGR